MLDTVRGLGGAAHYWDHALQVSSLGAVSQASLEKGNSGSEALVSSLLMSAWSSGCASRCWKRI